jgi:hypothetical protein
VPPAARRRWMSRCRPRRLPPPLPCPHRSCPDFAQRSACPPLTTRHRSCMSCSMVVKESQVHESCNERSVFIKAQRNIRNGLSKHSNTFLLACRGQKKAVKDWCMKIGPNISFMQDLLPTCESRHASRASRQTASRACTVALRKW